MLFKALEHLSARIAAAHAPVRYIKYQTSCHGFMALEQFVDLSLESESREGSVGFALIANEG